MTQIFVGFLWFVALGMWTLGVYLLGKYLGQGEAYRAGMSAGFSEGRDSVYDSLREIEQIAGLWSDGDSQTAQAQRERDTTILPPKGEE